MTRRRIPRPSESLSPSSADPARLQPNSGFKSNIPASIGGGANAGYVLVQASDYTGTWGQVDSPGIATGAIDEPHLSFAVATQAELDAHINDTSDAHDASAISYNGSATISATDVEGALDELDTEKLALTGGTLTGGLLIDESSGDSEVTLDANGTNESRINFTDDGAAGFSISFDATAGVLNLERNAVVVFAANETTGVVDFNETPTKDGASIWHAGNDGTGSGLDADLLDGSHASAFVPYTIVDAKGDLIAGTAADTAARLAVGTNEYLLTGDSSASTGLKWRRPDHCRAYRSAAYSPANALMKIVGLDAEAFDNYDGADAMHDPSSNNPRIYARRSGLYIALAEVEFAANATGQRFVQIALNDTGAHDATLGSTGLAISGTAGHATTANRIQCSWIGRLTAGDWISMAVYQSSGGALALTVGARGGSGGYATSLTLTQLGA